MNVIAKLYPAIIVGLTGCSTMSGIDYEYPDKWAKISNEPKTCSAFSGEYINEGQATGAPYGGSKFLAFQLGMEFGLVTELKSIEMVRVSCINEDVLLIEAIAKGVAVRSITLKQADSGWVIEDGVMKFRKVNASGANELAGYVGNSAFSLSVATDGSLIGKDSSSGAGLILWVVPAVSYSTYWYKWTRMQGAQ